MHAVLCSGLNTGHFSIRFSHHPVPLHPTWTSSLQAKLRKMAKDHQVTPFFVAGMFNSGWDRERLDFLNSNLFTIIHLAKSKQVDQFSLQDSLARKLSARALRAALLIPPVLDPRHHRISPTKEPKQSTISPPPMNKDPTGNSLPLNVSPTPTPGLPCMDTARYSSIPCFIPQNQLSLSTKHSIRR